MISVLITFLLFLGLIFFAGGSVGIIRFPDFYSRLHPAGKLDTGGLVITMTAFSLYTLKPLDFNAIMTSIKIILILVFVFVTSPTAIHSIVDAGVRAGLEPWEKKKENTTTYDLAD